MKTRCGKQSIVWGLILTGTLFMISGAAIAEAAQARAAIDLDGSWEFRLDPTSVGENESWFNSSTSFADAIQVPGAWDAQGFGEETEKLQHNFVGKGWYRRSVPVPADWKGRPVFICFGGVYRSAKVWVNGQLAGSHLGYSSNFEFDITKFLTPGSPALVAIQVDSEQDWSKDTLQGCMDIIDHFHTFWGGIWSHVSIEARSAVWMQDLFIAPRIEPAGCEASAEIVGESNQASSIRLTFLDAEGHSAAVKTEKVKDGSRFECSIDLPEAQLWTPENPYLYTARVELLGPSNELLDSQETRFGVRTIEIKGTDFYVNGKKYYLNGYGDDCVYTETIAPPADKQFYIERLRLIKSFGFNYVRHHSHFVSPEYYEACDEMGMFVSPELPIGYPRYYERAQGPALELYKSEWTAVLKRYRNHPSIFDWCMSNELWEGMPRVGQDLYNIAKGLDKTRPVIDSDGVFAPGFIDGTKDRPTMDFFTVMFSILTSPFENQEKFKTAKPLKPIITHEEGNFVHFPRLDEIELFTNNFKPFWLTDCRDRIAKAGLLDETPEWSLASEQLYLLCHKANIEAIRKNPYISGYDWWLFQPWVCGSNGLVDIHFRTHSVTPEQVKTFNAPLVILQNGVKQTYRAGETVEAEMIVSNYSGAALENAELTVGLASGGVSEQPATLNTAAIPNGDVVSLGQVKFVLPDTKEPMQLSVSAALGAGGSIKQTNGWTFWVFPAETPKQPESTPLYVSSDLMALLAPFAPKPMPEGELPSPAVYVSRQPSEALARAAEQGSCVVLLSPAGVFPMEYTTFKSAWWMGVFDGDSNAGTYVYDNPVTKGLTPGHWCDASWFNLLQGSQTLMLESLEEQPEVLIRALNTQGAPHGFSRYVDFEFVWRNKSLLAQAKVGKGAFIISGLNFDLAARNGGSEAGFVLGRLLEYAATFPTPKAEWSSAFVEKWIGQSLFAKGPVVSGFSRMLYHKGPTTKANSYRELAADMYQIRQEEPMHLIKWETAPAPDAEYATFVFAGGFPCMDPPRVNPGFTLVVNGKRVIDFDTTKLLGSWQSPDGSVSMVYLPAHIQPSWGETSGLFFLAVPKNYYTPGQPCTIEVRPRGGENNRYFGLHAYSDILLSSLK